MLSNSFAILCDCEKNYQDTLPEKMWKIWKDPQGFLFYLEKSGNFHGILGLENFLNIASLIIFFLSGQQSITVAIET